MSKDYYHILGVDRSASADDIKKAFRKMAHQYHPDKEGGDEARFKEASEAYSVLGDAEKRKQYDQFGSAGPQGFGGGGGFNPNDFSGFDFSGFGGQQGNMEFDLGDIFSSFFGGGVGRSKQRRGEDASVILELTFKESILGARKTISVFMPTACSTCSGTGGDPSAGTTQCSTCKGSGQVRHVRSSILGQIQSTAPCDTCGGTGTIPKKKCAACDGAGIKKEQVSFDLDIPAGVENGSRLKVRGKGPAIKGGAPGDLYVSIRVKNTTRFEKDGNDLLTRLSVPLSASLLGTNVSFETLDATVSLEIPAGSRHGDVLTLRGKGVPGGRTPGDILITLDVTMPKKLSKKAKELLEQLKGEGI